MILTRLDGARIGAQSQQMTSLSQSALIYPSRMPVRWPDCRSDRSVVHLVARIMPMCLEAQAGWLVYGHISCRLQLSGSCGKPGCLSANTFRVRQLLLSSHFSNTRVITVWLYHFTKHAGGSPEVADALPELVRSAIYVRWSTEFRPRLRGSAALHRPLAFDLTGASGVSLFDEIAHFIATLTARPDQDPDAIPAVAQTGRAGGQVLTPLDMRVSPMMTSDAAISSVNTGVAASCTSLAPWAANAASSA